MKTTVTVESEALPAMINRIFAIAELLTQKPPQTTDNKNDDLMLDHAIPPSQKSPDLKRDV